MSDNYQTWCRLWLACGITATAWESQRNDLTRYSPLLLLVATAVKKSLFSSSNWLELFPLLNRARFQEASGLKFSCVVEPRGVLWRPYGKNHR